MLANRDCGEPCSIAALCRCHLARLGRVLAYRVLAANACPVHLGVLFALPKCLACLGGASTNREAVHCLIIRILRWNAALRCLLRRLGLQPNPETREEASYWYGLVVCPVAAHAAGRGASWTLQQAGNAGVGLSLRDCDVGVAHDRSILRRLPRWERASLRLHPLHVIHYMCRDDSRRRRRRGSLPRRVSRMLVPSAARHCT